MDATNAILHDLRELRRDREHLKAHERDLVATLDSVRKRIRRTEDKMQRLANLPAILTEEQEMTRRIYEITDEGDATIQAHILCKDDDIYTFGAAKEYANQLLKNNTHED